MMQCRRTSPRPARGGVTVRPGPAAVDSDASSRWQVDTWQSGPESWVTGRIRIGP
jgi:hypothetical protein